MWSINVNPGLLKAVNFVVDVVVVNVGFVNVVVVARLVVNGHIIFSFAPLKLF